MSGLEAFIIRGHEKIIDHYRRLRDSAPSRAERERFQRRIEEEEEALRRFLEGRSPQVERAA
ncbi:hypothetical protein JQ595_31095 [Bradyrhizobium japonicum]|uniref:hypothetical protein n=1 Tax=Bradyrhizobium japonicum TaxID=375 RepID=UPI001BA729D4|nr:hypothetical protein [Bradyrhizobium japonicum]MBR0733207.1 hypothetical protein [Bradyrhizobium japonicum]